MDTTITLLTIMKCLAAILIGIFAGNGAVYLFNHMPAQWFCDYGKQPTAEMTNPYTQRVKSYPWKYIFTMLFVIIGIKLVIYDWQFAIAGVCATWLLLEMAIADIKYRIVPDQLILLLAICALGFIPFHGSWRSSLIGALIGFGIMALTACIGRLAYKRDTLGGGDIKLFASLGLILGATGILTTLVLTTLISAAHLCLLLARKKITKKDTVPMVPYIAMAASIYIVFLWQYQQLFFDIFTF